MSSVETVSNKSDNGPLTVSKLTALIEDEFNKVDTSTETHSDELIKCLLQTLSKHSSQFKYIVNLAVVDIIGDDGINIENKFGASWNAKKDGLFNHIVADEKSNKQYVFTIAWISK